MASDDTVMFGRVEERETSIIPVIPGRHAVGRQPVGTGAQSRMTFREVGNTRVLVLGGTSGIGRACAEYAARMGVVVEAVGREQYDIRDFPKLRRHIVEYRPTHVVYSVGINILAWAENALKGDFHDLMAINVWGFIETVQILIELHAETTLPYTPSLVAVSSDAARRPMRTSTIYCATKAALDQVVRVLARERGPAGWRINAVAPGKVTNTAMTAYVDAIVPQLRGWTREYADAYEKSSNAIGEPASPAEVAQVVMDVLFGPPSLNGAIIDVNGGR